MPRASAACSCTDPNSSPELVPEPVTNAPVSYTHLDSIMLRKGLHMAHQTFDVRGMTCAACQAHVDRAVGNLEGVSNCLLYTSRCV